MKTKMITLLAVCWCLTFIAPLKAQAQSAEHLQRSEHRNHLCTCTLLADSKPVWLWVDEEPEANGGWALMRFAGKLERGGKWVLTSGTDRIRYSYKTAENDELHGNVGAWCYKGNTIKVP
jgi:hypothetical protein